MDEKKYQIFISSTFVDLKEERRAVIETILNLYHIPIGMEMFSAGDEEQWAVITRAIDAADYYVVLVGFRYGSIVTVDGIDISYTEREYNYAISKGIPVLAFVKDESAPSVQGQRESSPAAIDKLNDFRSKIQKKTVRYWASKDELTTFLATSLHNAFSQYPRAGWIAATFDPFVMSQEIAALSKENRELRAAIDGLTTRIPQLDFSLVCDDELKYTFEPAPVKYRLQLTVDDIPENLISELEANDKAAAANKELIGMVISAFKDKNDDDGNKTIIEEPELIDYRQRIIEAIKAYNSALPSQQAYDEYNSKMLRFWNLTKNSHKVTISIENFGTSPANDVTVELSFPPELLVFDDYGIEDVDEPKKLDMPQNPLTERSVRRMSKGLEDILTYANQVGLFDTGVKIAPRKALIRPISGGNRDYYTSDEDYLCFTRDKLLHTYQSNSDAFYVVVTKTGVFNIEGSLICDEISEPIKKTFTITVN